MKKKILSAIGIAAVAAVTFMATNSNGQTGETSLTSLLKINTASAECCSTPINNGRCSFSGNCFANPGGPVDCDTTKGNC
ncbi:hypothetical protein [Chitinophaga arvensicola]|uniref:NVEALA protein n=1 Tax=Chitinophaga arvensicola TaxID=29529 RepID=A0A1I0RAB1_9BACT|nr:hypothetical protein [Chitinophaga arvensicola]SEW37181.1 hypothetical protein SAMN04488122_2480 [Chitinophaga arvensicola]